MALFDHIEELKREYTDTYVAVDSQRPELRRFEGQTGIVRTVNMNGNALVEFDANANIGWYDIDIRFLRRIDGPLPRKDAKEAPRAKSAAPQAAPKPGGMSVEAMLAAARGEKSSAPATKPKVAPAAGTSGMSVADMMAAARAEKSAGGDARPSASDSSADDSSASDSSAGDSRVAESSTAVEPAPAATPASSDLPTDTASIVAYCRNTDGA